MKSFIYGHIHLCRWITITLSFKLQAPSLGFKLMHKPSSPLMVHFLPHGYVLVYKLQ
jgi:hypothetical protein